MCFIVSSNFVSDSFQIQQKLPTGQRKWFDGTHLVRDGAMRLLKHEARLARKGESHYYCLH